LALLLQDCFLVGSCLLDNGFISGRRWHWASCLGVAVQVLPHSHLSSVLLTSCRRRDSPYLPPLPNSEDWFCQCHSSQRPRRSYRWLDILLANAYSVAEEEMGSRSQVFGLCVVQATNLQRLLRGHLLCRVS
jgi:hypothetical protein